MLRLWKVAVLKKWLCWKSTCFEIFYAVLVYLLYKSSSTVNTFIFKNLVFQTTYLLFAFLKKVTAG